VSRIEGSGKRSLRRPKLSTRKFSAWKKKKKPNFFKVHTIQTDVYGFFNRRNTELRRSDGANVLSLEGDIKISTVQCDDGSMALL
jgi:hypothetical protein